MKHLKKFSKFMEARLAAEPETKPAPQAPTVEPDTKPERRERPSPIRRDEPSVTPAPQAKKKELIKANVDDVVESFFPIAKKNNFDYKKYFPNV